MAIDGAAWAVSVRAGREDHLSTIERTLSENARASWQKMTRLMAWQRIGAASWDSSIALLTLVVSLGAVRPHVGPWLRQLSNGKLLVQGRLEDRNGQTLVCTHFTPGWCVHHWVIVRGTGPAVAEGPIFLGDPL